MLSFHQYFFNNFSTSLARVSNVSDRAQCVSVNNEPCIVRPTLIDLNPVAFNYYPIMIRLNKCNESCNAAVDLSAKIFVPSKAKDVKAKVLNITTRKNEEKKH